MKEVVAYLSEPRLVRTEAADLSGCTPELVDNWMRRFRQLELGQPWTPRRYSFLDVLKLALMRHMTRECGLAAGMAAQVVPEILEHIGELVSRDPETGELRVLVSEGAEVVTLVRLRNGRAVSTTGLLSGMPGDARRSAHTLVSVGAVAAEGASRISTFIKAGKAGAARAAEPKEMAPAA
jgi:hypothetical protein